MQSYDVTWTEASTTIAADVSGATTLGTISVPSNSSDNGAGTVTVKAYGESADLGDFAVANGTVTFTINPSSARLKDLAQGEELTERFFVEVTFKDDNDSDAETIRKTVREYTVTFTGVSESPPDTTRYLLVIAR